MKTRSIFPILATLPILLAASCESQDPSGVRQGEVEGDITVQTGREFTLSVGQTAHVEGTEVLIHFAAVDEDSRCPIDVQCPWQGDAEVRLEFSSRIAEFAPQPRVLHTGVEPREVAMLGVVTRLVDVGPAPRSTVRIDPQSYRATLVVTR